MLSQSGHGTGIFLKQWEPCIPYEFTEHSSGLIYTMGQIMKHTPHIKRVVIGCGEQEAERERIAMRLDGGHARAVFLPQWFFLDITVAIETQSIPQTMTVVQTVDTNTVKDGKTSQNIWFGKLKSNCSWKKFGLLADHFGLSEIWNKIHGTAKPSWGIPIENNGHFFADTDCMTGVVRQGEFPTGYDIVDLGRIEHILEVSGINILHASRSFDAVTEMLKVLSCGSDDWAENAEKILQEEHFQKVTGGESIFHDNDNDAEFSTTNE